jgi:Ca2+/Na+ antiporter
MAISYKRKQGDFLYQTRKRVIKEVFILIILSIVLFSSLAIEISLWLKISILALFSLYILFGVAYYPKAKKIADSYKIFLLDAELGFQSQDKMNQIPFKDLKIIKVIKDGDEVIEIRLKTVFNQSIKLQGLDDMNELYAKLAEKV